MDRHPSYMNTYFRKPELQANVTWKSNMTYDGPTRIIHIGFRRNDEHTEKFIENRVASIWTGSDIIHTEFYFPYDNARFSATMRHSAALYQGKSIKNSTMEWWGLCVSEKQYKDLYAWAKRKHNEETKIDTRAFWCGFCCGICSDGDAGDGRGYVCSSMMAEGLQESHIMQHSSFSRRISPHDLFRRISTLHALAYWQVSEQEDLEIKKYFDSIKNRKRKQVSYKRMDDDCYDTEPFVIPSDSTTTTRPLLDSDDENE